MKVPIRVSRPAFFLSALLYLLLVLLIAGLIPLSISLILASREIFTAIFSSFALVLLVALTVLVMVMYLWRMSPILVREANREPSAALTFKQALLRTLQLLGIGAVFYAVVTAAFAGIASLLFYALQTTASISTLHIIVDSVVVLPLLVTSPFLIALIASSASSFESFVLRLKDVARIGIKRYFVLFCLAVMVALVLAGVFALTRLTASSTLAAILSLLVMTMAFGYVGALALKLNFVLAPTTQIQTSEKTDATPALV